MRQYSCQLYRFKSTVFKKTPKYSTFRTLTTVFTSSSVFECFAKETFTKICVCSMDILLVVIRGCRLWKCFITTVYGTDVTAASCVWTLNNNIFRAGWWICCDRSATLAHGYSWLHYHRNVFLWWWRFRVLGNVQFSFEVLLINNL